MNEIKLPELPSWTAKYVIPENDDLSGAQFLDDALIAYARAAVTADRAQRASLETAMQEWANKTEWVQQTCQPEELGMHRADILKARIAELEARLAEAQKDAARYRWLRNFHAGEGGVRDELPYIAAGENYRGAWALHSEEADTTIDAAIAAQEQSDG